MEENNQTQENSLMRISVKQTAKGFAYWDISARGNCKEEVEQRLKEVLELAIVTCSKLNVGVANGKE